MIRLKNLKILLLSIFSMALLVWIGAGTFLTVSGTPVEIFTNTADVSIPMNADDYAGNETCKACHEDQFKNFSATVHGKITETRHKDKVVGCESCHGPGKAHAESGGDITKIFSYKNKKPVEISQTCTACHSQTSTHATWKGSKHETAGLSCLDCHNGHHPSPNQNSEINLFANTQAETKLLKKRTEAETCYQCHSDVRKSEYQRSTHLFRNEDRESRMTCSACHDAHGSAAEKLMKSVSLNDTCYTCHTEKRGPFLWEHAPSRENCANCHTAHGSNHINLLKKRAPMLCQNCHIQGRHQTVAGKPISAFMMNRGCLNCHSQVHGSNHPSGINLQR